MLVEGASVVVVVSVIVAVDGTSIGVDWLVVVASVMVVEIAGGAV